MQRASRVSQIITLSVALLVTLATACDSGEVAWDDPISLPPPPAAADAAGERMTLGEQGEIAFRPDSSDTLSPTQPVDARRCPGSLRVVPQQDGSFAAAWWSVRSDSSAILVASRTPVENAARWEPTIAVDTADVSRAGCRRPAPSIAASAGLVHLAYSMKAREGTGVFYAHSMTAGQNYEPALAIIYGDRLSASAVAADRGIVAVAYEDPSGASPPTGLAISLDWGHLFGDRTRASSGFSATTNPLVAVRDSTIAVSWAQVAIEGRTARIGRLR
jgi:hypothetical protein